MDLNYTGDTTSGREGIDLLSRGPGPRPRAADRRHDRLGIGRHRGRGDAPRRAQLRPEALGQRSARRDPADRGRGRARAAAAGRDRTPRARRGAAHSAQAAARQHAAARRLGSGGLVAAGVRRRRRLLRRHPVWPGAPRPVDRRRRRQGHSRGAADVEPAGRPCARSPRTRPSPPSSASRSTASSAATSPKAGSSRSSTASSTTTTRR